MLVTSIFSFSPQCFQKPSISGSLNWDCLVKSLVYDTVTIQVLQEELRCQEPLYDKFIQSGNAVHDKCVPESKDAAHISEKMTVISKSWERLSDKLREREKSLTSVEGVSTEFSEKLQELSSWTSDYMTTVDNLAPVSTSMDKHEDQLREIKVI